MRAIAMMFNERVKVKSGDGAGSGGLAIRFLLAVVLLLSAASVRGQEPGAGRPGKSAH